MDNETMFEDFNAYLGKLDLVPLSEVEKKILVHFLEFLKEGCHAAE